MRVSDGRHWPSPHEIREPCRRWSVCAIDSVHLCGSNRFVQQLDLECHVCRGRAIRYVTVSLPVMNVASPNVLPAPFACGPCCNDAHPAPGGRVAVHIDQLRFPDLHFLRDCGLRRGEAELRTCRSAQESKKTDTMLSCQRKRGVTSGRNELRIWFASIMVSAQCQRGVTRYRGEQLLRSWHGPRRVSSHARSCEADDRRSPCRG